MVALFVDGGGSLCKLSLLRSLRCLRALQAFLQVRSAARVGPQGQKTPILTSGRQDGEGGQRAPRRRCRPNLDGAVVPWRRVTSQTPWGGWSRRNPKGYACECKLLQSGTGWKVQMASKGSTAPAGRVRCRPRLFSPLVLQGLHLAQLRVLTTDPTGWQFSSVSRTDANSFCSRSLDRQLHSAQETV
jgi:hypothetical protein